MGLMKIAMIELVRKPGKNGLIVLAIAIAVTLLTSLTVVSNSANTTFLEVIARTGHTLTVRPAVSEVEEEGLMSNVVLKTYIPESAIPKIEKAYDEAIKAGWEKKGGLVIRPGIGEIDIEPPTWAPRLYEKVAIDGTETLVSGVDFYKEYFVRFWWTLASGIFPADASLLRQAGDDEALIGGTYSRASGITTGDSVQIKGVEFNVVGVLEETNSADDYMVFIPLGTAQRMFDRKGLVSLLSVRAMCPNCPVGDAMIELNKKITGITAVSQLDLGKSQYDFFNTLYKFMLSIVVVAIVVCIFTIFNIVTGSLYSRVKEIGLLKSVGASRSQLLRIYLYEHFIMGLAGGLIGFLLGAGIAYVLNALLDIGAVIRISPQFLWMALAVGVVCSLIAIFYPAYKLSKVRITETFRTQWEV